MVLLGNVWSKQDPEVFRSDYAVLEVDDAKVAGEDGLQVRISLEECLQDNTNSLRRSLSWLG